MKQRGISSLVVTALLWLLLGPECGAGIRFYKSREDTFTMLGGKNEIQLYFSNCDQSSQRGACVFAMDSVFEQIPTQCATTDLSDKPWWLGILETPAYVTTVTLLNMNNSHRAQPDALYKVTVMANDEICFTYDGDEAFDRRTFPCDVLADGIAVRSSREGVVMSICDVEVHGVPLKFPTVRQPEGLLKLSLCKQSSYRGGKECDMTQDGDPNTCIESHKEKEPWIEFLLSKPSIVTRVVIKNYKADYKNVKYVRVTANSRLCSETYDDTVEAGASMEIECNYFGNRVRIETYMGGSEHDLNFCEIEIFGHEMFLGKAEKFSYIGCYNDKDDHDLPMWASSTSMSLKKCYRMCKRKGFKYFAVQHGRHCYCGSSYGKHGTAQDKSCNENCQADAEETCGGKNANSVYEITAPIEAVPETDNDGTQTQTETEGGAKD